MQVWTKITSNLKFLCRRNRFLLKGERRFFDCACAVWYQDNNKKYAVFAISFIWRTSQARNAIGNTSAKLYCKAEILHNSCGGWKVFYNYLINILKNVCDRTFLSFVLAWPMVKKIVPTSVQNMFNHKHCASRTAILACQLLRGSQK